MRKCSLPRDLFNSLKTASQGSGSAPSLETLIAQLPVHYGKFRGTFILVAKISTFGTILGLSDQVARVLVIYFTQLSLRKASGAIRKF